MAKALHDDNDAAELARLRAENARLTELTKPKPLTFKVSPKGGVSVYGVGRFPVTLYREQWVRVLDDAVKLRDFIEANRHALKAKGD
jgi:hypothetical protein